MVTLDRSHCAARRAWNSPALDLERQERGGHGGACRKPGLVHDQPWHSQRDLYPGGSIAPASAISASSSPMADKDYFSEEKRDTRQTIEMIEDGVPAFRLVNSSTDGRYRITKIVFSDPLREVVLQQIHFEALTGTLPTIGFTPSSRRISSTRGADNTGWCGSFKGHQLLCAQGRSSRSRWPARCRGLNARSAMSGFPMPGRRCRAAKDCAVSTSARRTATLRWLARSISLADGGRAVLTIGFGALPEEAGLRALLSLQQPQQAVLELYCHGWRQKQAELLRLDDISESKGLNRYRVSTSVLATHRDEASGAIIASLSIPWGFSKGDDDLGGYHLIWPRDLVETAGGLLACGALDIGEIGARLSGGHPGSRRPLVAELLARWASVLERHPDRRNRISDPALRHAAARRRDRARAARALHGDDPRCRGLHHSQRAGDAAGSLGRGWRLFRLHDRGRNLGAARGGRRDGGRRRERARCLSHAQRPMAGTSRSTTGPMPRIPRFRESSASTAITCGSAIPPATPTRARTG